MAKLRLDRHAVLQGKMYWDAKLLSVVACLADQRQYRTADRIGKLGPGLNDASQVGIDQTGRGCVKICVNCRRNCGFWRRFLVFFAD